MALEITWHFFLFLFGFLFFFLTRIFILYKHEPFSLTSLHLVSHHSRFFSSFHDLVTKSLEAREKHQRFAFFQSYFGPLGTVSNLPSCERYKILYSLCTFFHWLLSNDKKRFIFPPRISIIRISFYCIADEYNLKWLFSIFH